MSSPTLTRTIDIQTEPRTWEPITLEPGDVVMFYTNTTAQASVLVTAPAATVEAPGVTWALWLAIGSVCLNIVLAAWIAYIKIDFEAAWRVMARRMKQE